MGSASPSRAPALPLGWWLENTLQSALPNRDPRPGLAAQPPVPAADPRDALRSHRCRGRDAADFAVNSRGVGALRREQDARPWPRLDQRESRRDSWAAGTEPGPGAVVMGKLSFPPNEQTYRGSGAVGLREGLAKPPPRPLPLAQLSLLAPDAPHKAPEQVGCGTEHNFTPNRSERPRLASQPPDLLSPRGGGAGWAAVNDAAPRAPPNKTGLWAKGSPVWPSHQTTSCLCWVFYQCRPPCALLHHQVPNGIPGSGMCNNQSAPHTCTQGACIRQGEPGATPPGREPRAALPSPAQGPPALLGAGLQHGEYSRSIPSRNATQALLQLRSWAWAVGTTGTHGAGKARRGGDQHLTLQPRAAQRLATGALQDLAPGLASVLGPNFRC
ncbi:hypothetical protein J1605_019667 [Eschrichtius robustus]|uniref:Uncharacterized protein n=1 Tax=Eschrichtius robustus TaxID=9764 RepID=A0AB34HMT5_ESCRO|nr:hypothetical protein J1605_019667 [Eschrichtius robustus]